MTEYAWLIPLLPLVSFLIIVFITKKSNKLSALFSIAGISFSFFIAFSVLIEQIYHPQAIERSISWIDIGSLKLEVGILLDPLSVCMLAMVSLVASLIQIYSIGYMHGDKGYFRYFSFMSLFAAAMLGLVISNNLLLTFICWELVGLCSYLLIGFWYHKKSAADAAKKAFIVTRFGDLGFLIGMIALFWITTVVNRFSINEGYGTLNFMAIKDMIDSGVYLRIVMEHLPPFLLIAIPLLIFCGAVGKSAQFPLHVWLPDAMEGPTPVSALIHAATMVAAGVFLVARTYFLFAISPLALFWVAIIGIVTAFIAATMALVQNDCKRILAYSTISQLGYMMLGLGCGVAGYTAGMFHLLTHAFFKALLFLGAGSMIHATHTNDIWEMGGLWKKMKITGTTFIIASLSISGIWPLSGFWSKDEILLAAKHTHPYLYYLAAFIAFLTAFYMFRLCIVAFWRKEPTEKVEESPAVMTVPLCVLALFSIFLGFVNSPYFHHWFGDFVFFGEEPHHLHLDLRVASSSTLLAVLGIGLAWLTYQKRSFPLQLMDRFKPFYTLLSNKYYMDDLYLWIVRKFVFGLATMVSIIDIYIVDLVVNFVGWLVYRVGLVLRYSQTGWVQHYAYVIYGTVTLIAVYTLFRLGG